MTDPTVAAQGKWKIGGALEYWYIKGKIDLYDQNGQKAGEGDINFKQPGYNLFAGYGDWTLQATHRSGSGDLDANARSSTVGATIHYAGPTDQTDNEFTLRYLIRPWASKVATPYVIIGYASTDLKQDYTITTPGWIFTCSGTNSLSNKYTYKGPEAGIGGIFPFSASLGLRVDGRLAWYSATRKSGNCAEVTGNGLGSAFTLTGYWNVGAGFNVQAGGKFTNLNGGDAGSWGRWGYFGMLGYSFNF